MANSLEQKLEQHLQLPQLPRWRRILRSPMHLFISRVACTASRYFGITMPITAKTFFNERMTVVLPETVSRKIFLYGFFEEGLTRMILQHLKPGMTFFDVGPHFGLFSLLAARILKGTGAVHAFEPTRSSCEILRNNLSGFSNTTVHNVAVWSKDGSISFNDFGLGYSAFNSLYAPRRSNIPKEPDRYEVPTISLDNFARENDTFPDFVKIDAESAEMEILKGMSSMLSTKRPIISIEVGDADVPGAVASKDIVQHILDNGYHAYEAVGNELRPHVIQDQYRYENLLFVPQ